MKETEFKREEFTAVLKKELRESGLGVKVGKYLIQGDIAVKMQVDTYSSGRVEARAFYNGDDGPVSTNDWEPAIQS